MSHKVLVTGGAGFIGSHLVDTLLQDGYDVLVLDSFDPYYPRSVKEKNIEAHLASPRYTLVEADIRSRKEVERVFQIWKPEIVVHLAAKAGVRPSLQIPELYSDVNISGTINVLDASRANGVQRFVFGSSSSVYGLNEKVPFSEEDPTLQPASPYGASKAAGEAICRSYSNCFGLPIVALRFFTVYGPRQRPDLAIHSFARKILNDEPIPLFGDGSTSRDYTFVADIVSGIRGAMALQHSGYEAVNLGNDRPHSLLQLVTALEGALGKKAAIEWKPMQIGDVPRTWADIGKAERLLGYRPAVGFTEGMAKFVEWLRQQ